MSFTEGSIVFADTGTFSADGVAPGTGTWSISTNQNSTRRDARVQTANPAGKNDSPMQSKARSDDPTPHAERPLLVHRNQRRT